LVIEGFEFLAGIIPVEKQVKVFGVERRDAE
jgi:hypothetical protein